ncbi:CobN/magnesium chelatase domain protein [Capnocytophaga sp. oral taxon 863 str. F0517]|uniref:cobaltochelatase subunit CobN n=1 Tax=Capnocytophaga sp. oral taxon 863 TaxID=1227265 RepID=UPI0003984D21|nr:cobaltochelatase subunit CobN [Capnocytophaga sp. oral taxon 863]ERI61988.1 CobN/magnesium chelatase domain protein [Capnocytophaga sp. oral taxon 863 str. F0517]
MTRKKWFLLLSVLLLCGVGYFVYQRFVAPTRIALVNFMSYQSSNIILSNKDKFIKFEEVSTDELDKLKGVDFVLVWGMGMKVTEEQHNRLIEVSQKVPFHSFAVTNPDNDLSNLSKADLKRVSEYLESGSKENYQNLARYIRKYIDKKWFALEPAPAIERKENVYFHLDDELSFDNLQAYEAYLKEHHFYQEGAPKVAIVAGLHDPFAGNKEHLNGVIKALQDEGMNVYPFTAQAKRMTFLEEINPDAIVYFPHGQMMMGAPEQFINWIKQKNIPFFTGLSVLTLKEKWEKDPMGMAGGFLGQTVVMPELDGALYPYVVIAQDKNKDGYYFLNAIGNRAAKFAKIIHRFTQLKKQANADKKLAIVYFKGVGLNPPVAQGLEVVESLYSFLKSLKREGYKVEGLPATVEEFNTLLNTHANTYRAGAKGEIERFFAQGQPALVEANELDTWLKATLPQDLYKDVVAHNGAVPGNYLTTHKEGKDYLAVAQLTFGNVTVLPQPPAAISTEDDFKVQHGVKEIPPYAYIGAYLWVQNGLKADALIHFGTHGSLEFTPHKQVTLSDYDWGDILVGTVPHFYYYTIGNIGEAMMAKRRSYGSIVSYLTPAFTESDMRNTFTELENTILSYQKSKNPTDKNAISLHIKKLAVGMGLHRDLRLDSLLTQPYTEAEIDRLSDFAEEIATEKINGELYTMGAPYSADKIASTVVAMSADPIAYSVAALNKIDGKVSEKDLKRKVFFSEHYLNPAKALVSQVLAGKPVTEALICTYAHITPEELAKAKETMAVEDQAGMPYFLKKQLDKEAAQAKEAPGQAKIDSAKGKKPDAVGKATKTKKAPMKKEERKPITEKELAELAAKKAKIERARAIVAIEEAITHIIYYRDGLQQSPYLEEKAFFNALSGGYTPPSSGGDAVANPKGVPTGHNLYSINAESTPSKLAWDRGVALAQDVLNEYKSKHGEYPKKIAYTFWSSEFVETEGVSIAQALYMLGVEPIWDTFGRVGDIRLIPSEELGRPRIDVVIQTSGQFRDLAASRLFLLTKAIEMVSALPEEPYANQVSAGTVDIEKELVAAGVPPKEAREMSTQRIFGGLQGRYDTGIKELINAGDKWETQQDIAQVYMHNMGAFYGTKENWSQFQEGMFRAAIKHADVLIQPRQNNTWGALSLDHVYEFMGGMNAAIKEVTGKDPDAYLADYRNHKNMHLQELKEAIGVEARSTILNPKYIKEMMKGKASAAGQIQEIVTNMHGWEATRPELIDDALWNEVYDTYIEDKQQLGVTEFIKRENAVSLEEVTAVMLEATRKGMWKASAEQITKLATLHTDLVKQYGVTSSHFSSENKKLQAYISQKAPEANAQVYQKQLSAANEATQEEYDTKNSQVLQKEETSTAQEKKQVSLDGVWIGVAVLVALVGLVVFVRKRRK